jgi:acetylornithine deacetylase/succinyl-diaminopimelate desuccinylase-like protein
MNTSLDEYFKQFEQLHIEHLQAFLRIPSVSALPEHHADLHQAAQWTAQAMRDAGLEHVEVMSTEGYPVVYGDWLHAVGRPTVLVYGHYDVQPADPLEIWDTPPFDPHVRDDKIYARGATDDKGQLLLHIKAVEGFLRTVGSLPINIKFCIEGEEEIASDHLPAYIDKHQEKLQADVITLSDTTLLSATQPALMYSLRGLAGLEIEVEGAKTDLHSGIYGGGIPNPIHALTRLLHTFHSADGRVNVQGFYDDVVELTDAERRSFQKFAPEDEHIKKELHLDALYGETGYSYYERTTARPTLEITSIHSGFMGEGIKPIIPRLATAKIACRLVVAQDPEAILRAVEAHVHQHAPVGVKVTVHGRMVGQPFLSPIDHPYMLAAGEAYQAVYGTWPVYTRGGGSIPIVETLARILRAPVVMLGFGLPSENLHAPNEHFHLDNWRKGLQTISRFWINLPRQK